MPIEVGQIEAIFRYPVDRPLARAQRVVKMRGQVPPKLTAEALVARTPVSPECQPAESPQIWTRWPSLRVAMICGHTAPMFTAETVLATVPVSAACQPLLSPHT